MSYKSTRLAWARTIAAWLAAIGWAVIITSMWTPMSWGSAFVLAQVMTAVWMASDAALRGKGWFLYALGGLLFGPIAVLLYKRERTDAPIVCLRCGRVLGACDAACPSCGFATQRAALRSLLRRASSAVGETIANRPSEQSLQTTKHMTIALAVIVATAWIIPAQMDGAIASLVRIVWTLALPAYWVILAWWVYMDAKWRRMEPIPWALLTLVTNIFGAATYLVIRYPDPRTCPNCGASLTSRLRMCPYCGSETESTCPRCQTPVQPDWVYCPSCAAQLPKPTGRSAATEPEPPRETPTIAVKGTVCDALSGAPIVSAVVKIDSRLGGASATTDALGRYMLTGLEPKPYVLMASAPGHASTTRALTPDASGSAQIDFSLYPIADPVQTGV